jgi:hypothetical protein
MELLLNGHLFPIYVYRIGHNLEGIEADAERQSKLEKGNGYAENTVYVANDEVGVLKQSEHTYIVGERNEHCDLAVFCTACFVHPKREKIVY